MAQKILLKRSSVALKVPASSSLDLGELGANTNDGKLFIKEGNHLVREVATTGPAGVSQSLFLSTASAAVVGIGTTNVTATNNLVVAGDAFFSASTLQPGAGNITASGNISSSGQFIGASANIYALTASNGFQAEANSVITNASTPKLTITDTTNDYALELEQGNTAATIRFNNNASQDLIFASNGSATHLQLDGQTTGSSFAGDITASGDISASGHIYGDHFIGQEGLRLIENHASSVIVGFQNTTPIKLGKSWNPISLIGNVTASNNISASGYVTASVVSAQTGSFSRMHVNNIFVNDGGALYNEAGTYFKGFLTVQSNNNFRAKGDIYLGEGTDHPITIEGNTTASGNISATGIISASQVYEDTYYQFEATAKSDTDDDDNWQGPNSYGIHTRADWNYDYGTDYDDITAVNAETRTLVNSGWKIPDSANYSASIENMDIYVTANSNITHADDDNFSCSLWYSKGSDLQPEYNVVDGTAGSFNQRHAATAISTQFKASDEALYKYNLYHVSASIGLKLAPGAGLYPRIKTVGTNGFTCVFHWIVNYKKIPL